MPWHEAERVGHWRPEKDPTLLEEIPGEHRPAGELQVVSIVYTDELVNIVKTCELINIV